METNSHNRGSPQQLACYWIRSKKFLTIGYQASNQRLTLYMYIYIIRGIRWWMMFTPGKVAADLVPKIINVSGNGKSVPGRPLSRSALESVEGRHHQMGKTPMLHVTPMEDPLVTPSWWPIQHDPTVEDLIRKLLWNMLKLFKSFKAFQSLLNILGAYFSGWVPDSGQDSHQVLSEVYPWRRLAHTWCDLCCRLDAPRMMGKDMPLISTILLSFILGQLLGWILCYVMAPSLTSQHLAWGEVQVHRWWWERDQNAWCGLCGLLPRVFTCFVLRCKCQRALECWIW